MNELEFLFLLLLLSIYESNALTEKGRVAWSQSRGVLEKAFRHSWLWWPRRWVRLLMVLSGLITLRAGEWQARCPWADIEVWLDWTKLVLAGLSKYWTKVVHSLISTWGVFCYELWQGDIISFWMNIILTVMVVHMKVDQWEHPKKIFFPGQKCVNSTN